MARFAQHHSSNNPQAVIGCVVPNLMRMRDQVERIFNEVFLPGAASFHSSAGKLFNLSAGKSFSSYPLIQTAFAGLKLVMPEVDLSEISFLLGSPFIGAAELEISARALLVKALHAQSEPQVMPGLC